jgi:hypothetical protein
LNGIPISYGNDDSPLTPVSDQHNGTMRSEGGGSLETVIVPPVTAPTAPSPTSKQMDPFELIDDVPSVHSEADDFPGQLPQIEIPTSRTETREHILTPPLTPPMLHNEMGGLVDGNKRLLSILGGYGWRG